MDECSDIFLAYSKQVRDLVLDGIFQLLLDQYGDESLLLICGQQREIEITIHQLRYDTSQLDILGLEV